MKPTWTFLGVLRPLAATLGLLVMTACGGGWGGSVGQKPEITGQPAVQTVTVGQAATFTVTATGTAPFTYQWYKGGVAISGATSNSYTTPATVSTDNGSLYSVTVTNSAGITTSAPATLTVAAGGTTVNPTAPTITGQPVGQTITVGQTATFTVTATGTGPISYQWYKGGVAVSGATSSSYTTPPTVSGDNGSLYTVAVTGTAGTVTSAPATLTVNVLAPTLTFAPIASQNYGNAPFTVSVTSASSGAVTYSVVSGPATISGSTVTLTGTGTVVLSANQAASGNYAAATANTSFTVAAGTSPLNFTPIAPQNYGNAPFTVSATSASSGAVTYSVVSGPATISGSTVTLTGTGTVVLSASQAASGNYAAATATTSFTVGTEVPTLSFVPVSSQVYGNAPFVVSATSASSGAVTYSVVSGPATISGNTVTLTGTGTVVLSANQAASGNYAAATATTSFTVGTEVPTLSFVPIASQVYGNAPFTVSATSASSGAVTYSVVSGPATISGSTVTLTGAGTVVLSASQAANGNYAAATATTSFTVAAGTSPLNFTPIASQTYGNAPFAVNATSASSGAITYSVVSGPATISGNTVTLTGTGTVVLSANQAANGNYAAATATTSFTVAAELPTLSFAAIASQTYGNVPFIVSATSASSGAVTYSVVSGPATISGSTVTLTGTGTVVLSASQAANGNYTAATTTTSFTVATEVPTLSFAAIASQTYGNAPFAVSATSASSGAVTYSVVSGPATISGNTVTLTGTGTVVLSASQAANGNYAAATANTSFTVGTQVPTLSFAAIASQTYGNVPFTVSATSASSGAVTYSVASGPATISGNTVTLTGAGAVVLSASQAANGNYAAATATTSFTVGTQVPTLNFAAIASQTYGDVPFAVSATSASSGAVTYSVVSGAATISGNIVTLTGAGPVVLSASQAANGNYAAATATTSFTVAAEVPTLTFAPIAPQTLNTAPFTVSATSASSGVVTYSVVSGPATISGNTVTLTAIGAVVLHASQAANGNYAAATANISFTVNPPPNVTITPITPANQTMAPVSQTFSATASGGVTNNLTWSASGGTFSGNVWTPPSTAGTYTITATSAENPAVSVSTTATISAPVITAQPVSKNVCSGTSQSLSVAANYATSYQWLFNGNQLGITTPTLTFPNPTSAENGNYSCTVTNLAGSVSSNVVKLNVVTPTTLTITSNPASVSVYTTQTATFSVAANGTGTLSYQWYTGAPGSGTAISGATSSTFTTGALTAANSGTTYYATVTDTNCTGTTVTSGAATLTVSAADSAVPPTIVVQPTGQTATVGGTATFSVTASGSGTLAYQWYRVAYSSTELSAPTVGVLISGATSSTYTVPASNTAQSNDGDNYYVVVTNAYGQAVSSRVVLAVGAGIVLQIDSEPQTEYVAAGTLASFSVTATCTGCIPAYQWYWYAPGATTATALSNGAVSSGTLSGATVAGATTSSLTLENAPTTATNAIFYVVVTSTSDGTTQISGTNPLTSSTAGLFVGALGTVGNTTAGKGLCNSSSFNWVLNGTNPGTVSGDVPYQNTSTCTIELTNNQGAERAAVYWPTLISTAKFSVSFTVQIAATSTPADGFTMVLADPSQGATTATIGAVGEGIGADGIPGFVLGFDTFQNGNLQITPGCTFSTNVPCDPIAVPYMAAGQSGTGLWENPWTFVNGFLDTQNSADYTPSVFANATHSYVVTVVNHIMTVTMDGHELFTGTVSLPPVAYLGFTASTGGSEEAVTFSNLTATVSAP
jgi:Immunoglobulin domain